MSPEKYLENLPAVDLDDSELSQARRLAIMQDKFDEILLDFKDMSFDKIENLYGGLNNLIYTLICIKNEIEILTNKLF